MARSSPRWCRAIRPWPMPRALRPARCLRRRNHASRSAWEADPNKCWRCDFRIAGLPAWFAQSLFSQMAIEEARNLLEHFLRLGRSVVADVMRVRHPLIDLKRCFHASLTKLAMNANRVAQKQVARAAGQDGRRESMHVAIDR